MRRFKDIGMYFLATGAMAISGFFSVPLLVRLLSLDEFGRWTLVEPVLVMGAPLALLGASWGVFKQVAHDGLPPGLICRRLLPAAQPMMMAVAALAAFVLARLGFSITVAICMAVTVWLEALLILETESLRAANMAFAFMLTQIMRAVALVGLLGAAIYSWVAVVKVGDVIQVRLLVAVVAAAAAAVCLRITLGSGGTDGKPSQDNGGQEKRSSSALYRDALRYGAPLLVVSLLSMVLQFSDRFIIKAYFDYHTLAHYFVYVKITNAIALLVVTPFALWWPNERFRQRKMPDGGREFFPRVAMIFLAVLLASSGSLWLITDWLLPFFAPGIPFNPAVILLLLFGGILAAMAYPLNVGLLDEGQTHKNIYAVLWAAIVNIILALILIPKFQLIGAAWANLLGYAVYVIVFSHFSQRVFPVVFAYGRMLGLTGLALMFLWGISSLIPGDSAADSGVRLAVYLCALLIASWFLGVRFNRSSEPSSCSENR